MDLRRAKRNLQLALDGEEEADPRGGGDFGESSLADRDLVETQVPEALGFSSFESAEGVFVSTQVQGRLDDALHEEALRNGLKRFKYETGEEARSSTKAPVQKKGRSLKRSQKKSLGDFGQSKTGQLLKQLSGKQSKVRDTVESQRKKGKLRARSASQYDTYTAEEWHHIHRKLLDHFPQKEPDDIREAFCYLYGPVHSYSESDLWGASQMLPSAEGVVSETKVKSVVGECHEVKVLTLSQVLSDNGNVESEDAEVDDSSTVPDSTDEISIRIPISEAERASTQFYTPRTSPAQEIIDPTQESFKVVKSLISPLKDEETPLVQVPATRTSTILTHVKQSSKSIDLKTCLRMLIAKDQVTSLKEKLSRDFDIIQEEQSIMSDTESEDPETFAVYLQRRIQPQPSNNSTLSISRFATQSAQKLRQSMKAIGLKPCRSKSQMIASLEAASQVLDSSCTELQQRHLIYDNLTKLVYSCPSLLERVYTYQPIPLNYLLARLTEANPFMDHVDEPTIRTWADNQGICLTSSS
ncbi:hypothetical protein HG536_0C01260 [Torulaspora globosa]|uniref:Structure-specific endonuclease subunit SLX4 n=1 Tax=Torulaspora globosa TaxID=48254 RepID=A0A7G3ZEM2_9SACH|nr:uncharacterized protein HG536_0C01260 [Torulaspora globosa]QLL31958.1 hypothetical protein HG536_0C01260 [Torulaspora globosa]